MNIRFIRTLLNLLVFLPAALSAIPSVCGQVREKNEVRREETADYFKKWLEQDVVYIISDEEREVFESLSTEEEKAQFIEQFWSRRDPTQGTAENEFKTEHYRRIAYANQYFTAGIPGWMTDRGKIYIIHGPPDDLESHPTGGFYDRPYQQGGGSTTAYPFERWWYRHIEGLGAVAMEFVDRDGSGDYYLAVSADEKDALQNMFGPGLNERADLGLPSQSSAFADAGTNPVLRDNPFSRYLIYSKVQAPAAVKFPDLKQLVEVNVSYSKLEVKLEPKYFRLDDNRALVPVTLQIENSKLTFRPEGENRVARLAIYGIVTSISNKIISEFDDEVVVAFRSQDLEKGLKMRSMYQKMLYLESHTRYKLDLVVKDLEGGNVGVARKALIPPSFAPGRLSGSSLVLSNLIQPLQEIPLQNQMFVLGDVRVRPSLDRRFPQNGQMGIYLQLYGASLDQATLRPSLKADFRILDQGRVIREVVEENAQSVQYSSSERVVLIHPFDLKGLPVGAYRLQVEIQDKIAQRHLELEESLQIAPFPADPVNP